MTPRPSTEPIYRTAPVELAKVGVKSTLELLATFLDTCPSDAAPETLTRIDATVRTLVTHQADPACPGVREQFL